MILLLLHNHFMVFLLQYYHSAQWQSCGKKQGAHCCGFRDMRLLHSTYSHHSAPIHRLLSEVISHEMLTHVVFCLSLSSCVMLQGWVHRIGDEASRMVNVNNRLVPENTVLQDGDFVVQSRELLSI